VLVLLLTLVVVVLLPGLPPLLVLLLLLPTDWPLKLSNKATFCLTWAICPASATDRRCFLVLLLLPGAAAAEVGVF